MSLPMVIRYPLDISGISPNNLVSNEPHVIAPNKRFVALNYGPFFTEGLVVRDQTTGNILTPNVDYKATHLYQEPTTLTSKEVCCMIFVENPAVTGILVTAQMLGGVYTRSVQVIEQLLEQLGEDDRPVHWGDIIGIPEGFPPAAHLHHADDWYGMEYVCSVLEGIRQALLTGDRASHEELENSIQAVRELIKFADVPMAIEGIDEEHIITPHTLRAAIAAYFGQFDVVLPESDEPWGYFREPKTNFTICFGTSEHIAPGAAYRCNYKRRFNHKPILSTASQGRSSATNNNQNSQYAEVIGNVADHTTTRDGFHFVAYRLTGSGTDTVRMSYVAVGYSDEDQPEASTPGFEGNIPPSDDVLEQPVWSGAASATTIVPLAGGSNRVGIKFTQLVSGGGSVVNSTNMTNVGTFSFTPYAGLFKEDEYEVMCTAGTPPNPAPVLTSIGRPLNTWIDLMDMKLQAENSLQGGFYWTAAADFTSSMPFTVTIRHKVRTNRSAARIFTIGHTTDAVSAAFPTSGRIQLSANTRTGDPASSFTLQADSSGSIIIIKDGSQYSNVSYEVGLTPGTIWNNRQNYEIWYPPFNNSQFGISSSGGGSWRPLSSSFNVTLTPNYSYGRFSDNTYMQIRHAKDTGKITQFALDIQKSGDAYTPVFSGATSVEATIDNEVGSYTLSVTMGDPVDGQGVLRIHRDGNVVASAGFNYSPKTHSGVIRSPSYNCTMSGLGGGLSGFGMMSQIGTTPISGTVTVNASVEIRHGDYSQERTTQNFTFTLNSSD